MTPRRPESLQELREALQNFATNAGVARGLSYQPGPEDVFISPYAKCGTTWMQQIVHGLRSNGSMAFSEITEVVPWLELAHDMGGDVNAPQVAHPRAFKCHLDWDRIPKGGRYIVVLRDPVDAMISLYRFFEGWVFEPGSISLAEFSDYFMNRDEKQDYWSHAASWWRVRAREDVLLFCFEEMKHDLPGTVDRVAAFIDIPDDPARRKIATDQARFEFMKAHNRQFDDHLLRAARDPACGLPLDGVSTKVNRGKVGAEAHVIPPAIRDSLDARWAQTLGAEFNLTSYEALRAELYHRE